MLARTLRWLRLIEASVASAAYAAVAILLMADVIGRELFETAILGAQQLAVYGAILAGFLGFTLATSDNTHLRPEFLDFVLKRFEPWTSQASNALSALFFFGAGYVAWTFVEISMDAGDRAPVLYFFVWPLQLIIPYAFVSSGLKHLAFAVRPDLQPAKEREAG